MQLTPREAFFAKRRVDIKDSVGKICGELICPYPPGIPVVIPGELISERALNVLLQAKAGGATLSGASDLSLSSIVICDV
ncbi:Arginine decarboxylase [Bienertia sinuspersici]